MSDFEAKVTELHMQYEQKLAIIVQAQKDMSAVMDQAEKEINAARESAEKDIDADIEEVERGVSAKIEEVGRYVEEKQAIIEQEERDLKAIAEQVKKEIEKDPKGFEAFTSKKEESHEADEKGYGRQHIEFMHGKAIRELGYEDAQHFIRYISENATYDFMDESRNIRIIGADYPDVPGAKLYLEMKFESHGGEGGMYIVQDAYPVDYDKWRHKVPKKN